MRVVRKKFKQLLNVRRRQEFEIIHSLLCLATESINVMAQQVKNIEKDNEKESSSRVDPWKVILGENFSYAELTNQFGLQQIDQEMIERIKKINPEIDMSILLSRGIFYAHQDLDVLLTHYEQGKQIYIYTGRGPSSDSLHLGHTLPLAFTAWLQKVFQCKVVIQMSDEEKYYFKEGNDIDTFMGYMESNVKDLIACGFSPNDTFIFSSFKYEQHTRPVVVSLNKSISLHVDKRVFGFSDEANLGMISWPAYQMAPAIPASFPHLFGDGKDIMCLVPCAVDQAPYFRAIRKPCKKMGYAPPSLICCKFLPGLQGVGEKASSSGKVPPIFLNDTPETVSKKIKKHAFSGGRGSKEHQEKGADLSVDISYIYLCYLMEDENSLAAIASAYGSGQMLSGEIKKILAEVVNELLQKIQTKRASVTNDDLQQFYAIRVERKHADFYKAFRTKYIDFKIVE